MARTLDGLFREAVRSFPRRAFLVESAPFGPACTSYEDAARVVAGLLSRLQALGFEPGDRVVCYADRTVPLLYFTLACAHLGVVPVPLPPAASVAALQRLAALTRARAVFATGDDAHRAARAGLRTLSALAGTPPRAGDELDLSPKLPPREASLLLAEAAAGHGPGDEYVLLPTSGTTGEPKLPVRTHGAQVTRGVAVAERLCAEPAAGERFLLVSALTHSFGHTVMAAGLAAAAELAVPADLDVHASLADVRALRPTFVFSAPRVLRALAAQQAASGETGPLFPSSVRVVRVAGAASDHALMDRLRAEGVDVGESYGSSECGAVALTPLDGWGDGSIGPPLPGVEVMLAEDGEVLVRVPGETVRYAEEEGASSPELAPDGFFRSGDCGELRGGRLRLRGRKKEVFNTLDGSNVYPERIEALLEGLPWVHQAVLVGDQRPYFAALLTLSGAAEGGGEEIDGHLDPARHPALYERARADMAAVNARLEAPERVRRFALFAREMPGDLYATVAAGKARRRRAAIDASYRARVEALYAAEADAAALVPDAAVV